MLAPMDRWGTRVFLALVAVAPMVGLGQVPVARAGDASGNIPGVPLSFPIAEGSLGGPIYDVVYRIQVPPSTLIVAALTGSPGTDFDLYLFDSTATTLYSTVGLVAKSTGPTSTERVSYPSRDGGTYYVDLNGASAVEGTFQLIVQAVPAKIPPQLSMTLAGGRPAVNSLDVPVALVASDALSTVSDVAFSADGITWGEWLPFSPSMSFAFTPGDGQRTLWAKARDALGLESAPVSASVKIDTVAPGVVSILPAPGSSVVGLRPKVSITFDEPIDPTSWTTLGLIVQAPDATLVVGTAGYDVATKTGWWIPDDSLSPGSAYIFTLGSVTDVAGNHPPPLGSWTLTMLAPVSLALNAPGAVLYGAAARLDVSLVGASVPAYVTVVGQRAGGGDPVPVANLQMVNSAGSVTVTPVANTTYHAAYQGPPAIASATVDRVVLVRRLVALAGAAPSVLRTARRGTSVAVTARITPAAGSITLTFMLYRYDHGARAYRAVGSFARRTDATGAARLTWSATSVGSFYWRIAVPSTVDYANYTSAPYRWSIRP
jgi:hypothetical protein